MGSMPQREGAVHPSVPVREEDDFEDISMVGSSVSVAAKRNFPVNPLLTWWKLSMNEQLSLASYMFRVHGQVLGRDGGLLEWPISRSYRLSASQREFSPNVLVLISRWTDHSRAPCSYGQRNGRSGWQSAAEFRLLS